MIALLALLACSEDPPVGTIEVASLAITLYTPAQVDPLAGADTLAVRVLDPAGQVLAEASAAPDEGLVLPDLPLYGIVDVEITARAGDEVLSAARTGPVLVAEGDARELQAMFLPINEAVKLDTDPVADRVEHVTFTSRWGGILLLGGRRPSSSDVHATTEWWDPLIGFGEAGEPLPTNLYGMASTPFADGELLVAGGRYARLPETERAYEAFLVQEDGAIAFVPPMSEPRDGHCLGTFQSSSVIAMGGRGVADDRTAEVLRPTVSGDLAWNTVVMADLVTSDVGGCVGTGSGFVVTTGRTDEAWGVLDLRTASIDAVPSSFEPIGNPPGPLEGAMLVPLADDLVWVLGGWDGTSPSADGWVVHAEAAQLTGNSELATGRGWASWRWWRDGDVVAVAGGYRDAARSVPAESVELVHLEDGPLLEVDVPLKEPRLDVIPGGVLILTGGLAGSAPAGAWAVMPYGSF